MKPSRRCKHIVFFLFACLLFVLKGPQAYSQGQVALSVEADVKHSRSKETKGDTSVWPYFSIFRDMSIKNCTLNIQVSNKSDEDMVCQLEWYFIADRRIDKETNPERIVLYPGRQEVKLARNKEEQIFGKTVEASFAYFRIITDEYKRYGSRNIERREYYEGDIYVGYVVLVTMEDDIIAIESSNTWLNNDRWIEKCRESLPGRPVE